MKNDSNTSESGMERTFWVSGGVLWARKGGVRKNESLEMARHVEMSQQTNEGKEKLAAVQRG